MTERRNLVICCAGDQSTHKAWLDSERNFDIFLVYFGGKYKHYQDEVEHWMAATGTKSQLLLQALTSRPDLLDRYDQFWLPDDDLEISTTNLNRLFDLFRGSGFQIAQPSLTIDSHASFSELTYKNMGSCPSNFVEIMCPLFSAQALVHCYSYLAESVCGWGIDWLWSEHARREGWEIGVFDQVQVGHYRPLGTGDWYRAQGIEPLQELEELRARHGLPKRQVRRLPREPLPEPVNLEIPSLPSTPPVIIGGQGGSCTRAVAEILLRSNRLYLDLDVNGPRPETLDAQCMRSREQGKGLNNPWFIRTIMSKTGSPDYELEQLSPRLMAALDIRVERMLEVVKDNAADRRNIHIALSRLGEKWCNRHSWGWKEPRSMYYLPFWQRMFGTFRFVHVVRDVRSISTRHIEGTPEFYEALFDEPEEDPTRAFEAVWAKTNLGAQRWAQRNIPGYYFLLKVENLAGGGETARRELNRLFNFLGIDHVDRTKTDTVFHPLREFEATPREGLVREALQSFGYLD